jgi:hypothetical protein
MLVLVFTIACSCALCEDGEEHLFYEGMYEILGHAITTLHLFNNGDTKFILLAAHLRDEIVSKK